MFTYAFQVLRENGYKSVETEEFENVADLCAEILIKGISTQIKRGLGKEYVSASETLSTVRGKIDVSVSIKETSIIKNKLVCEFDDFSINTYMNQIIKTTVAILIKYAKVSKARKKELKRLMGFFDVVDVLDHNRINWHIQYNKNNQTYRMLISICELVIKGLLQSSSAGNTKLMDLFDEQRMCRLYEKFILEYYRKEHPELTARASQIDWQLDDGIGSMLPVMQTDIMLSKNEKVLIIDAKYYSHTTQTQFDTRSINSGNLYQIFTYVKNKEFELKDKPHEVAGMLLYAKTDELVLPNNTYQMSGNKIIVRTLDLDSDFSEIKNQLDTIVINFFE